MSRSCRPKIFITILLFFTIHNVIAADEYTYQKFNVDEDLYSFESEVDSDIFTRIHEIMTRDEISKTFGVTDGPVPEHRVYTTKLGQNSRKKRQSNDAINLQIEINGREINLNLEKTDGSLVSKNTPVWRAVTDYNAYHNVRYDPLPSAMTRDIGPFEMYQDRQNEAAIVVYTDYFDYSHPHNHFVMEGIVTSEYALKSLPKRLAHTLHKFKYKYRIVNTPIFHKRSVEMNVDDDDDTTDYYVLFKTQQSFDNVQYSLPSDIIVDTRESTESRSSNVLPDNPGVVYPEILLILDHNIVRRQSIGEALRFAIAFWNGVDMIYSSLEKPKVRLNIAGIIVSDDDNATPYIANDTSIKIQSNSIYTCKKIGKHFYDEQQRFPWTSYDVIVAMTTMRLCASQINPCIDALGFAYSNGACSITHEPNIDRMMNGVAYMYYNMMFGGVYTAAHETAHLFSVEHNEEHCQGFVMDETMDSNKRSFLWSSCSQAAFRHFFSLKDSLCLTDKPTEETSDDASLPGKWLSLDGQCQNYGYAKACNLSNFSPCEIMGCTAIGSDDRCAGRDFRAIPGSRCNVGKHCDSVGYECVDD